MCFSAISSSPPRVTQLLINGNFVNFVNVCDHRPSHGEAYIAKSNLKKVTLVLVGKSAAIICNDADIDKAVEDVHFGLFFNQGQVCSASSSVFGQEEVSTRS